MIWHTVREGEDLKRIVFQHAGSFDAAYIRNLSENRELFESRRDTVLLPGDRIYLPEIRKKYVSVETEQRHDFLLRGSRRLRLVFENESGEPIANTDYSLNIEGEWRNGATDDEGLLDEPIPMNAENASIIINDNTHQIRIGHLDPVDSVSGVQARLRNLGQDVGRIDGDYGPKTREAVRTFQESNDIEPTGELDDQTQQALEEQHLC